MTQIVTVTERNLAALLDSHEKMLADGWTREKGSEHKSSVYLSVKYSRQAKDTPVQDVVQEAEPKTTKKSKTSPKGE